MSSHQRLFQNPRYLQQRWAVFFALCSVLFLAACTPPKSDTEVDEKAEAIMEAYRQGDVDKILTFYGEAFYKARSDTQWRTELTELFEKNGKVETLSFRNKQADTRFSGKFYIYQFDTVHTNKKRARHILTLIRHVENMAEIIVIGHQIKTR